MLLPPPVGITARVSRPLRTALIASSCPGRNESKPKISFSTLRGTNLIVSSLQSAVSDRGGDLVSEDSGAERNRAAIEQLASALTDTPPVHPARASFTFSERAQFLSDPRGFRADHRSRELRRPPYTPFPRVGLSPCLADECVQLGSCKSCS